MCTPARPWLLNDVVPTISPQQTVVPQRPTSHAAHLHILSGSTNSSLRARPPLIPDPSCTTIDPAQASPQVSSVLDVNVEHSQWLIVIRNIRRRLLDTLRPDPREERKVSSQERSHNHETSADYRKIGFDNAEGCRYDDDTCDVAGVEEARNVVASDCTDDTCSVERMLDPGLVRAQRAECAKALR